MKDEQNDRPTLAVEAFGDKLLVRVSGGDRTARDAIDQRLVVLGAEPYANAWVLGDDGALAIVLGGAASLGIAAHVDISPEARQVVLHPEPLRMRATLAATPSSLSLRYSGAPAGADLEAASHERTPHARVPDGRVALALDAAVREVLAAAPAVAFTSGLPISFGDPQRLASLLAPIGGVRVQPGSEALFRALATDARLTVPETVHATLRPYQTMGVERLRQWHDLGSGGVLADDMGLGKSLQTLTLLAGVLEDEGALRALLVAPTSVVPNWVAEARKFVPHLRLEVWRGETDMRHLRALQAAHVFVTSYHFLRKHAQNLNRFGFNYVILDEAQAIKNPTSATAQAARSVGALHRLALTGTPVENRLTELWSIFSFACPGLLGTLEQFHTAMRAGLESQTGISRLRQLLGPFLLRRLKSEVAADLPEKTIVDYVCPLAPRQFALYEAAREKARADMRRSTSPKRMASILAALTRLRQIACDPRLVDDTGFTEVDSGKLVALRDLLDQVIEGEHKAIVFSQFTSMLALIRRMLDAEKTPYCYLDGSTKDRAEPVRRFQSDPRCRVFLVSLKAGGTGLNLTAADTVILFDPWWNPAVEAQAIDRAHRIGQQRNVTVYRMIAQDTIEQRVAQLRSKKSRVAKQVLSDATDEALSTKDILDLLD